MNKKLLVISLDAFSSDDLAILKTKPHFKALCAQGTLVEDVETLYLSNTYPIHTSIMTGRLPKDHGIYDNTRIDPYEPDAHWNWWAHQIQGDTL
ncbi:MAG: alkaline phosphatase family protein, partial [Erysipelotrichaceae bacterium]